MGLFFQLAPGPELVEDFTSGGGGVCWLLVVWEVAEERKSILFFTFNTIINVVVTSSFPHSLAWGGGLLGSTQESRLVQLSEKTAHAVSGDQSTCAEDPVLSFFVLIVSAHCSACVSD